MSEVVWPKWDTVMAPLRLEDYFRREGGKSVRAKEWGDVTQKDVFATWPSHCTHQLSAAVVICESPDQDRPCQHVVLGGRTTHEVPLLRHRLLVDDGC